MLSTRSELKIESLLNYAMMKSSTRKKKLKAATTRKNKKRLLTVSRKNQKGNEKREVKRVNEFRYYFFSFGFLIYYKIFVRPKKCKKSTKLKETTECWERKQTAKRVNILKTLSSSNSHTHSHDCDDDGDGTKVNRMKTLKTICKTRTAHEISVFHWLNPLCQFQVDEEQRRKKKKRMMKKLYFACAQNEANALPKHVLIWYANVWLHLDRSCEQRRNKNSDELNSLELICFVSKLIVTREQKKNMKIDFWNQNDILRCFCLGFCVILRPAKRRTAELLRINFSFLIYFVSYFAVTAK